MVFSPDNDLLEGTIILRGEARGGPLVAELGAARWAPGSGLTEGGIPSPPGATLRYPVFTEPVTVPQAPSTGTDVLSSP